MKNKKILKLVTEIKENEIIKDINLFYTKNKKICKFFIYIFSLAILYLFLFSYAKDLETRSTFPGSFIKFEDKFSSSISWIDFEEINLYKKNWQVLNGLYIWTGTWKTVYYFHGNWWPNPYFYNDVKYIYDLGYNVMMYDYPGYWKSDWTPYKENIDNSSQDFYEYLKKEKNIESSDLIIWWYSVWTAIATDFASKNEFDKLILISPFSSRYDMSRSMFWVALQKFLFIKDSYITKDLVKDLKKDVLIIHWNQDNIVPFEQWKLVYNNYLWNKNFIELDWFSHNWVIYEYWFALQEIFKNHISWNNLDFENNYLLLTKEKKEELENQNKQKIEDENQKIFLKSLDLKSDDSLQTFVTSNISFNDKTYIPKNLVNIRWDYIYDAKWWTQLLRKEAKEWLDLLSKAFYEKFSKKLVIVSAYRSYEYQVWIKSRGCPDNLCAKAWFSEHQTWLAFDIFEASTNDSWKSNNTLNSYYDWLSKNAHFYGFHNTYQKWLKIDGYEIEPWHWRYVWVELATYLYENNLTFAEFYRELNK